VEVPNSPDMASITNDKIRVEDMMLGKMFMSDTICHTGKGSWRTSIYIFSIVGLLLSKSS
jgi:hypothetical protein